jgi:N-acetylglucosaminyl-diphospho-decaprenol L-rhamnosyltransferase
VSSSPLTLSVILVSYNSRDFLPACLESLAENLEAVPHEIIVVDNASSDGSADWVAETAPNVRLIANRENKGYPIANNQGIAVARGEYVLLLNPDTIVGPGVLMKLVEEMNTKPQVGVSAPALRLPSGRIQVSFGGKVNVINEAAKKLFRNRLQSRRIERDKRARSVGWLGGACLLCRNEVLKAVQGFDERFFLYFEDIDLCFRIRALGKDLLYVPALEIRHEGGASTSASSLQSRFHYRRSQLHFYRKHESGFSLLSLKVYLWISFCGLWLRGLMGRTGDMDLRNRFFTLLRDR